MADLRIYKYELEITDAQRVRLPKGSTILSVQDQGGTLCLWALCDITQEDSTRYVYIVGTGNSAGVSEHSTYVGTVQMMGGRLVWHVFAGRENASRVTPL
jgi:hypothetical protein